MNSSYEGPSLLTFSIVIALVAASVLWISKPYLRYEYVRMSDQPVTIQTTYQHHDDPTCTRLYINDEPNQAMLPVFANTPSDLPNPNEVASLRNGDQITLIGYRYAWRETNVITGSKVDQPIYLMDIIGWQTPDTRYATTKEHAENQFQRKSTKACNTQ